MSRPTAGLTRRILADMQADGANLPLRPRPLPKGSTIALVEYPDAELHRRWRAESNGVCLVTSLRREQLHGYIAKAYPGVPIVDAGDAASLPFCPSYVVLVTCPRCEQRAVKAQVFPTGTRADVVIEHDCGVCGAPSTFSDAVGARLQEEAWDAPRPVALADTTLTEAAEQLDQAAGVIDALVKHLKSNVRGQDRVHADLTAAVCLNVAKKLRAAMAIDGARS